MTSQPASRKKAADPCPATSSLIGFSATACLALLFLTVQAVAQTPQKPPAPEPDDVVRVYSELVQTDVMVFDKQGKFVNGLKREDFELRIDGKPRPVEFFERIAAGKPDEDSQLSAARGSNDTARKPAAAAALPFDRGRTIFFYVDDLHLKPTNFLSLRKMLLRFIDQNLGQNDMAAVTSSSGAVGFLQQLSDNKTVLRAAVERLSTRTGGSVDMQRPPMSEYQAFQIDHEDRDVKDYFIDALMNETRLPRATAEQMVQSRAREILQFADSVTKNSLAGLEGLVRSTSRLPGRKLIIFMSDGFFIDDRNSDSIDRLRKITSAAARSGVVIYSMDMRGLVASLDDPTSSVPFDPTGRLSRGGSGELMASQDAMNSLARDTGGKPIFNTNALDLALVNAINETSVYYLLAWRPDPKTGGDKFRKISVSLVDHPGWTVRVRQGFFDREAPALNRKDKPNAAAAASTTEAASEKALREEMREPFPLGDLPVATSLEYFDVPQKGAVLSLSVQVNTEAVQFVVDGTGLKGLIDIRGTVYNDHGKAGATFSDRLTITAKSQEELERGSKELVYYYQVYLPPGLYQVRSGARDPVSGKVGASFDWVEIPDLTKQKLALSSVITGERSSSQAAPSANNDATGSAYRRVDHRLERNSMLRFIVYIYNAQKSPTDGQPDVAVQVQILRDSEPVLTTPSKKIATAGVADLSRLPYGGDLSLEGLGPGHYIVQLSVVDRVAKTSASQRVKLEIK
jgi:VWFA-related protein